MNLPVQKPGSQPRFSTSVLNSGSRTPVLKRRFSSPAKSGAGSTKDRSPPTRMVSTAARHCATGRASSASASCVGVGRRDLERAGGFWRGRRVLARAGGFCRGLKAQDKRGGSVRNAERGRKELSVFACIGFWAL